MRPLSNEQRAAVDDKVRKSFTQDEMQKLMALGPRRVAVFFGRLLGKVCYQCRLKILRNPRTPMSEYCEPCQKLCTEETTRFLEANQ